MVNNTKSSAQPKKMNIDSIYEKTPNILAALPLYIVPRVRLKISQEVGKNWT